MIALFQQHFVKTGDCSSEVARALPRAFEKRLSSDYSDFVEITRDEVVRIKCDVHSFVTAWREHPGSTRVAVAAGDRSSRHSTGRSASGQRTNGWWGLTDPDLALRFTGVWLPRGFVVPNYSLRRIYCEGSRLRLTGMILPLRYSGLRIGYAVWTERIESCS